MAGFDMEQYIKWDPQSQKARDAHPQVKGPVMGMINDATFGGHNFVITWWPISQPFEMVSETHFHDFDQYLMFFGGDANNLADLGGEVELTLGEQGGELQKLVITRPAIVWVKAGMRHGPLNFKKIYNPQKPILYNDITFTVDKYERKK